MNQKDEIKNTNKDDFQLETKITLNFTINGLFKFNDNLIVLYSDKIIKFYSKKLFQFIFEIDEFLFNNIRFCKKNKEDSLLVYSESILYFVQIIENCEYRILSYLEMPADNYTFNSSLDLLTSKRIKEKYEYFIELILYSAPDYITKKFSIKHKCNDYFKFNKILIFDDNHFLGYLYNGFRLGTYKIDLYSNDYILLEEYKLNKKSLYDRQISIIDLNNLKCEFYAFIAADLIYLVNKNNFTIAKTIKFNYNYQDFERIDVLKINNNHIDFIAFGKSIYLINYEISMGGIKWQKKSNLKIMNENSKEGVNSFYDYDNNKILFNKGENLYLIKKLNQ